MPSVETLAVITRHNLIQQSFFQ